MNHIDITKFAPLDYAGQEAVNTLCTNISFFGSKMKRIMLTSTYMAEGKSFVSLNILRTMARYGKNVCLVDADLRRSYIASQYGLRFAGGQERYGLAHYLAEMAEESSVIYSTNIEGAYIVPAGREVSNPLPLLNSEGFAELLDHLAAMFDYVIVDAPPIGTVIDAAEIAKSCDGALIVVKQKEIKRQELIEVRSQLEQTGCAVLGAVLNMVEYDKYMDRKYYKSEYSHYKPASEEKAEKKRGFNSGRK